VLETNQSTVADRSVRLPLLVLAALVAAIGALESMPFPALPLIQRELGLDPAQAGLLSTTLILTGAVAMPIVGKLADNHDPRRVLLGVTWCLVAGGTLAAFAGSFGLMLAAQFLQGIGTGIVPVTFALVRGFLPAGRMPPAVGLVAGVFVLGGGLGILSAGPLADALSRRWMFLTPTLVVAALALVAPLLLPRTGDRRERAGRLDWLGALLLAAALVTLMMGLSLVSKTGWPASLGLLALAGLLTAGWTLVERRARNPLIDLRLLQRRGVWSSCLAAAVMGAGYAVSFFLIPQLLALPPRTAGFGFGASPSTISLYLFPPVVAAVIVGPLAGFLVRRLGSRAVVGTGLALTATGALVALGWHSSPWQIVLSAVLTAGLGACAASTALYTAVIESVPASDTGVATALSGILRGVGAAVGVQVAAAVLTASRDPATALPREWGFQLGFALSAGIALLPLLTAFALPGRARQDTQVPLPAGAAVTPVAR
jgi:predicted MFS family arabinose efflux permease